MIKYKLINLHLRTFGMITISCSGLSEVLTLDQARQSNFLSTMIEYDPTLTTDEAPREIELPFLSVNAFSSIVQFLRQHQVQLDPPTENPVRLNKELLDLLYFAEYMDIPSLILYLTNHIASILRYQSIEYIKSTVG